MLYLTNSFSWEKCLPNVHATWESEAIKMCKACIEILHGTGEKFPFISKYIFLLRNTKNGGQRDEQADSSESRPSSFFLSLQKTEFWLSVG